MKKKYNRKDTHIGTQNLPRKLDMGKPTRNEAVCLSSFYIMEIAI